MRAIVPATAPHLSSTVLGSIGHRPAVDDVQKAFTTSTCQRLYKHGDLVKIHFHHLATAELYCLVNLIFSLLSGNWLRLVRGQRQKHHADPIYYSKYISAYIDVNVYISLCAAKQSSVSR